MTTLLPHLSQIGLCSSDLPHTKKFYADLFGFEDAHGDVASGPEIASLQEIGEDSSLLVWWMTGRQKFVQLELFHHFVPAQRPLPADWRVSDIGWSRVGIRVADFDACLARLGEYGAKPIADPVEIGGQRRFAFRDPYVGSVIEVIENADRSAAGDPRPALANVAVSVSDLNAARKFWIEDLGLPEDADFTVDQERQRLWGLEGAEASGFSTTLNDIRIEVMSYRDPVGRRFEDRLLSDQGIMNIALAFRDRKPMQQLLDRLQARGYDIPAPIEAGPLAVTYIWGPERISVEMFCTPEEFDSRVGFVPRSDLQLF